MKANQRIIQWLGLLALATLNPELSTAYAQGTAVGYQGQLNDWGHPANGIYDLRFTIYDAFTNGNAVSGVLTQAATPVTNGAFTLTLDFGAGVFTGSGRWLQVDVQTNGGGAFTALAPRQAILPLPYAVMAHSASNLLGTLPAAQLSGTLPSTALVGYAGVATLTNPANTFVGTFTGNGGGLTNLALGAIRPGTITSNAFDAGTWLLATQQVGTFFGSGVALTNLPVSSDWFTAVQPTPILAYNTWADSPTFPSDPNGGYGFPLRETNLILISSWMATNGYKAAGWQYVWIDDGWQYASLAANGDLLWETNRFPHGLPYLVAYIHQQGLKAGIYTSFSALTCDNFPGTDENHVYQHVRQFADWGFDALKVDFCLGLPGLGSSDGENYALHKMRLFNNAVLATGRRMILLNNTGKFPTQTYAVAENSYIGVDMGASGMWQPCFSGYWMSLEPMFTAVDAASKAVNYLVRPGRYTDMTQLFYWQNCDWQIKAGYGIAAIVACDVQTGSPAAMRDFMQNYQPQNNGPSTWMNYAIPHYGTNREWAAIHQDAAVIPGSLVQSNNYLEVWVRPLGARGNGHNAVLLVNLATNGTQNITVPWSLLGVPDDTWLTVRSVWGQTNLGTFQGHWTYAMPQTDTELFSVSAASSGVVTVSTLRTTNTPSAGQVLKYNGTDMYWANP